MSKLSVSANRTFHDDSQLPIMKHEESFEQGTNLKAPAKPLPSILHSHQTKSSAAHREPQELSSRREGGVVENKVH